MWFFFFTWAVDVIVYASWDIPSFGILWIVCFWLRCYACTYALYIKVEFLYTSLWCHLYNNITSLVINGRKSFFFIYICVCLLCMYISHTYHASFYTLHITFKLQSCACCFLMQIFFLFFFLQKFNSNKWCYLFRLKIFASCCVFFCVAMQCNCFHFYRFFLLCFDTNLQINFTQFSGKICIDITQISVLMFFFISVKMSKKDFFFQICILKNV